MSRFHRQSGVLSGQSIQLRTLFTDDLGNPTDPDTVPAVYIYDESVDDDVIEEEMDAGTYASALAGPLVPSALSTGYFELVYAVPSGSEAGTWHDCWVATLDSVDISDYLEFTVAQDLSISTQANQANTMIIITLESTITNDDGDAPLSGTTLYYLHTLSPLYASPDQLRMEVGEWISYIPDATIASMLHYSSLEADFIQRKTASYSDELKFARNKFVIFDAAYRCLNLPGHGITPAGASSTTGGNKSLGDLAIEGSGTSIDDAIPTIDEKILEWISEQRQEWWRVVNAGASIPPGAGFGPQSASKSLYSNSPRVQGRLWEKPSAYSYPQPGANTKERFVYIDENGNYRYDGRRGVFRFGRSNSGYRGR